MMNPTPQEMVDELIALSGGSIGDVEWTSLDGVKTPFRNMGVSSIMTIRNYIQRRLNAAQSQLNTIDEQGQLGNKATNGVVPGKFKKVRKELKATVEGYAPTIVLLDMALEWKKQQDLTVSPMMAKLRASSNYRHPSTKATT